jgi:hypothetical protein
MANIPSLHRQRLDAGTIRSTIKSIVERLSTYSLYNAVFELPYIKWTAEFYTAEGDKLGKRLEATAFFDHCTQRIEEEKERLEACLDRSSWNIVVFTTEESLLSPRVAELASAGMRCLICVV